MAVSLDRVEFKVEGLLNQQTISGIPNGLVIRALDNETFLLYSRVSENASRRNLDRSISERRPYLQFLNYQLKLLNWAYPRQRTSRGKRMKVDFGTHSEIRNLILDQARNLRTSQVIDRSTVTALY